MTNEHKQYNLEDHVRNNPVSQGDFDSTANVLATSKDLIVKNRFFINETERITKHGQKIGLTIAPSVYTLLLTDFFVGVRSVSVAPTITLPKASIAGLGKIYIVKDLSGSALTTTITISPQTGETINGDTGTSIATNYGFVGLFTDGSNWFTS